MLLFFLIQYEKYQNNEFSGEEALEMMIKQATLARVYKGHTLFNRRHKETSEFYNNIAAVQAPIIALENGVRIIS